MAQDQELVEGMRRLAGDLELFCALCLKIADKQGRLLPFAWNKAQRTVHAMLEEQKARTGRVRAIVLKARQQGISTYVAARYYHRTTMSLGQKALIVGHEQKSTNALYTMVKRFQEFNPLTPATGATNAQELVFSELDGAGYRTMTAGSQDVGRGNTAQLAHLSEVAFWRNPELQMAGLGNAIADADGTEIIIESTANGVGSWYHKLWQDAVAGKNEWLPIFIPWFYEPGYRLPVREGYALTEEDERYKAAYRLDDEQMQWLLNKRSTYGQGMEWLASQEYPASAAEAFQSSTTNPLIDPAVVQAAVNTTFRDAHAGLVIGCDPAGDGVNDPDRTSIVFRRGRMVPRVEYHESLDTMQIAGKLAAYHKEHRPSAIFVDKGGLGAGVVDRLTELGVPVIGVLSSRAADDPEIYENKRAEMWWRMKDWFEDQPCRIPNDPAFISDITAPQPRVSSNGRKLLEKKEHMKTRGIRSPDGGDALALTFAYEVATTEHAGANVAARTTNAAPTRAGY